MVTATTATCACRFGARATDRVDRGRQGRPAAADEHGVPGELSERRRHVGVAREVTAHADHPLGELLLAQGPATRGVRLVQLPDQGVAQREGGRRRQTETRRHDGVRSRDPVTRARQRELDPRIVEPVVRREPHEALPRDGRRQDHHGQPLQRRPREEHAGDVAEPDSVQRRNGGIDGHARRLELRLRQPIVRAGELDAVERQRLFARPSSLHQAQVQRRRRARQRRGDGGPATDEGGRHGALTARPWKTAPGSFAARARSPASSCRWRRPTRARRSPTNRRRHAR